jgi:hypothetical protein
MSHAYTALKLVTQSANNIVKLGLGLGHQLSLRRNSRGGCHESLRHHNRLVQRRLTHLRLSATEISVHRELRKPSQFHSDSGEGGPRLVRVHWSYRSGPAQAGTLSARIPAGAQLRLLETNMLDSRMI